MKFIDQGIVYDELSEADKEIYENTFEDENGKLPEAMELKLNTDRRLEKQLFLRKIMIMRKKSLRFLIRNIRI